MGYLDYAGLQYLWGKLKEKFAPKSHSHDDRYYTEAEMDGKLNSKVNNNEAGADSLLSKLTTSWTATPTDNTYFIRQDTGGGNSFGRVKFSTLWNYIKGKTDGVYQPKGSYAASGHTHDDRYYTESEMNTKLSGKSNTDHTHKNVNDIGTNKPTTFAYSKSGMNYGDYSLLAGWNGYELRAINKNQFATASHTHNYAGSGSAGGSANSAVKLDSSAGSATQPVYFSGGKPVAIGYTIAKSVPADAKFTDTNTWRGIQNNLTSDSTDQSLSAAQGKALKTLVDGKAPASHTHTKSQITDFPSSMPASDVYPWAKAATKPSYTKAEVGLSNVDNTADKDKSVEYAASAGSATNAQCLNNDDKYMKFHWSGQDGQPTWLWGGNDSGDMYVYNPSNFNVNYATTAGNGTVDFQTKVTTDGYFGAVRFGNGIQICWFTMKSARNRTFLLPFADINYAIAFSGGYCWLNINNRTTTGFTVGVEWSGYENSYIAIGRWK